MAGTENNAEVLGTPAYELPWAALSAGGGRGSAGSYELASTLGNFDAFRAQAGAVTLEGGFWSAFVAPEPIFADGFETGDTSFWSFVTP